MVHSVGSFLAVKVTANAERRFVARLFVVGPEVRDDLGRVWVFDRITGHDEHCWRLSGRPYPAKLVAANADGRRRVHAEDVVLDLDPRAALDENVDLLAARMAMTDCRAPTGSEAQVADADVLAAKRVAQNPQLELACCDSEA